MAKQQQPFGGGPRIGNQAPGEPAPTPSTEGVKTSGKSLGQGLENRGSKAVGPNPSSEVIPTPFGGGEAFAKRPTSKPASGSGDGTGGGATSGADVP